MGVPSGIRPDETVLTSHRRKGGRRRVRSIVEAPLSGRVRAMRAHRSPLRGVCLARHFAPVRQDTKSRAGERTPSSPAMDLYERLRPEPEPGHIWSGLTRSIWLPGCRFGYAVSDQLLAEPRPR